MLRRRPTLPRNPQASASRQIKAVRSQNSAAPRPERAPEELICFAPAWHRDCKTVAFAQYSIASDAAPVPGNPASHPVTGSPPSGMKAPTRHRGLSPTRANMSRRPGIRSHQGIVRKTGGRVLTSANTRAPRPRALQARPAQSLCHAKRSAAECSQWQRRGIIPLRFILGKSLVTRPESLAPQPPCQRLSFDSRRIRGLNQVRFSVADRKT